MQKDNEKKYVIIRNTATGRLERAEIENKEVYDSFRRGGWAEERNDSKERKHTVCFTDLLPDGNVEDVLRELADANENVAAMAELNELQKAVRAAVKQLPPRQRQVIVLLYFEGLTLDRTAKSLGVNQSTVSRQRDAAMKTLGRLLSAFYSEFF